MSEIEQRKMSGNFGRLKGDERGRKEGSDEYFGSRESQHTIFQ